MNLEAGPLRSHPLYTFGEILKRLGEAAAGRGGASVGTPQEAAMRTQAQARLEKQTRELKKQAKEFTQKATSAKSSDRAEAQKSQTVDERLEYSKHDLNKSREHLYKSQGGNEAGVGANAARTPPGFESDPNKILNPEVVEFTASMTAMANGPAELRDPNIVYAEMKKMYNSFDSKGATQEQKRELRRTIDAGLKYARDLSVQDSTTGYVGILTRDGDPAETDYYLHLGIEGEKPFDLYRTRVVREEFKNNEVVDGKQLSQTDADTLNKERTDVDNLLKTAQRKLEVVGDFRTEEIKILQRVQEKLDEGFEGGKYTNVAEDFNDLVNRRLKHLTHEEEITEKKTAERLASGGRGRGGGSTGYLDEIPLTEVKSADESKALIARLPPGAKRTFEKIANLPNRSDIAKEELDDLRKDLHDALREDRVDSFLRGKITTGPNTDEYLKEYQNLRAQFKEDTDYLEGLLFDKNRPFILRGHLQGRAYFEQYEEDLEWLMDDNQFNLHRDPAHPFNANDPTDPIMERLYDIANGILDRGAMNDRAAFRENFDLFDNENWKLFISRIEKKLRIEGWDTFDVKQITNRFTGLREMRELVHDVQFAANFANLEMLNKMVANTMAGDLDAWFYYNPTMRYGFTIFSEQINHIMRMHNGHLPPELMDPSVEFVVELDKLSQKAFEQAARTGKSRELQRLHDRLTKRTDTTGMTAAEKERALKRDEHEHQKAEEEMYRSLRVARAFGTITLRTPLQIAGAKLPFWYGSGHENNLIQDVDPFRHLIFKYGLGKGALAKLYTLLTNDEVAGKGIFDGMYNQEQVFELFLKAEQNPDMADSFANFRNFFKMMTRFGDAKGYWGMVLGTKNWSAELQSARGAGLKLFDAGDRALNLWKGNETSAHPKFRDEVYRNNHVREYHDWWEKRSHELHHQIDETAHEYVNEALVEIIDKVPQEVLDRTSIDVGYEHLGFDAVEMVLRDTNKALLKRILRVDNGTADGGDYVVTIGGRQVTIRSLYDFVKYNPEDNPAYALDKGIAAADKAEFDRRVKLMREVSHQMATDLGIVQQATVEQIIDNAAAGHKFEVPIDASHHPRITTDLLQPHLDAIVEHENLTVDGETFMLDRRVMAQKYAEAIQTVIRQPVSHDGKAYKSYLDYLTERFEKGREHNIFTTSDLPFNRIDYRNWGSSVLSRTTGDAFNTSLGIKGVWEFFSALDGHPDEKEVFRILKESIKKPLTNADPETAINATGFCVDAYDFLYRESDLATNLGIVGKAMTSELVIETAEKISKLLGGHGKIPNFLWGSLSQRLIDPGALRMSASDVWSFTREAAEKNLLPQEHNLFGWFPSKFNPGYTKADLRARYHGNPFNVLPQAVMTIGIGGTGLMAWQAFSEKDEEHR